MAVHVGCLPVEGWAEKFFHLESFSRQPQRGCGPKPKVGAPAPTLGARLEPETTPTALRPTAQRCGNAATLGYESNESNNLNEVVAVRARVGIATTALRLEMFVER